MSIHLMALPLLSSVLLSYFAHQGLSKVIPVDSQDDHTLCNNEVHWYAATYVKTYLSGEYETVMIMRSVISRAIDRPDRMTFIELIEPLMDLVLNSSMHIANIEVKLIKRDVCAKLNSSKCSDNGIPGLYIQMRRESHQIYITNKNWDNACSTSFESDNTTQTNNITINRSCVGHYQPFPEYSDITASYFSDLHDEQSKKQNDENKDNIHRNHQENWAKWRSQCDMNTPHVTHSTMLELSLDSSGYVHAVLIHKYL